MAINPAFTDLAEIKPYKTSWRVQVKIVHLWKQYTKYTGETLELILADKSATKIHATVKKQQMSMFQRLLEPGQWRIIEHFSFTKAMGKFRATDHAYRMTIMNITSIVPCAEISFDMFLNLAEFGDIHHESKLNDNILIDVIGQVVNIGEMKTHEIDNKLKKKLEFELRNTRDERLPCTLWGTYAERMLTACQNNDTTPVICLLRFAKINTFKGARSVSNAFDMTDLQLDPLMPEATEFFLELPNDGLALTIKQDLPIQTPSSRKRDSYKRHPSKTVGEILDYHEEGKSKVLCTVYAIDTEFAWYYFVCLKCNNTVYKIPKIENDVVKKDKKPEFWCNFCLKSQTRVEPRFRLILCVMDATARTKCVLFENDAALIVQQSSIELLNGMFEEVFY